MKIVLYNEECILEVVEDVVNPIVVDNNITWDTGEMTGINPSFLLVENDVEVGGEVNDELLQVDKKDEFKPNENELEILREESDINAMAIMSLTDFILGGGE